MSLGDWYLNGTKLCPWNFSWSESKETVGNEARLLNGGLRRDIVARKLKVDMSWSMLPETFDGTYHCYEDLRALGTSSGTVALIRPIGTSSGTQSFGVFVEAPSGNVAHRSDGTDVYWDCSITVREG